MQALRSSVIAGVILLGSQTLGAQQTPDSSRAAAPTSGPTRPGAFMNLSFVGLTSAGWSTARDLDALELGDHDPRVRGFTIPNAEIFLDGAVDPYLRGSVNLVHKLDSNGETVVELEEMWFITTSLPANLQVKGGQFFVDFGRQNLQHPHSWAFADQQLVIARILGPEGLRGQGAKLSWLLPTPVFAEASITVLNSAGGTTASFRSEESSGIHGGEALERPVLGGGDMLYIPRFTSSFDVTGTQTVVLGVSGAAGPNNSGPDARTRILGADLYWKWKSARASGGFPFVAFTAEALARRYDAASRRAAEDTTVTLPEEVLNDVGAYGQLQWGIRPRIVAAVRVEALRNDDSSPSAFASPERGDRSRYSTNLTWFPSEFSKFRVQYNYDHRAGLGYDHSLWMQFEFLLGSHAAHKF